VPPLKHTTGYLASNQEVLICTTHIEKVIAKLYSFTLRSKITENVSEISQTSEISLDTEF